MTTVYLAPKNFTQPIPSFKERKIAHLAPGKVSDSQIRVLAPFFVYPTCWFKFVLHTILTNTVTTFDTGFTFNLFRHLPTGHPFEVPVCTFRFSKLSTSAKDELKGMGLQQDLTNDNLFVGTPSPTLLKDIASLEPLPDRIRPGHISFDGFYSWAFLIKGITAITTIRNTFSGKVNMAYELKKSVKFDKDGELVNVSGGTYTGRAPDGKRAVATTGELFIGPDENVTFDTFGMTKIDDSETIQGMNGIFFEYFHGLSTPDKSICGRLFQSWFTGCCGTDMASDAGIIQQIISGSRTLAYSRTGMSLAHIYRCIEISCEVPDAMVFPIIKGHEYVGTAICGDFSVVQFGEEVKSGNLKESFQKLDRLSHDCKKIAVMLNSVNPEDESMDNNSQKVIFTSKDFQTSRQALRTMIGLDRSRYEGTTILDDVVEILADIPYGDTYAEVTISNIQLLLKAIVEGDIALLDGYSAFLSKSTLNPGSPVARYLAMFGPRAPACSNVLNKKSGLQKFNLRGGPSVDPNLVLTNGKRHLRYLPIWTEPFGTALKSWESLRSTGELVLMLGRKGKNEFTDTRAVFIQVGGNDFEGLYNSYRSLADQGKAVKVEKRKRDDDDMQKGKRVKHLDML